MVFVNCERLLVARINQDFVGDQVLNDPALQRHGASRLSLLTYEVFAGGMSRIKKVLQQAKSHGEQIVFPTHLALHAVVVFVPEGV